MMNVIQYPKSLFFFVLLAICVLASPLLVGSQTAGQNAVFNGTGGIVGSSAFIDASMLPNSDICTTLYSILSSLGSFGAVIDARGVASVGISLTCTGVNTPWYNGTTYLSNVPSTILLPPGTIQIHAPWVIPSNTHLIGEGDGLPSNGASSGTTIQIVPSYTSASIIEFGYSTNCCTAITVENLVVDGNTLSVNGIVNEYAQDQSYIDHVGLYRILGTGLLITGASENSGPYTSIAFDTGGVSGTSSTVCAQILTVTGGTHGIHGLSCRSSSPYSPAGVLLDSSGNSVEDLLISGFYDGVLIGENASALGNVLINVVGDTSRNPFSAHPVNTIHIANSGNSVHDMVLKGVSNSNLANTNTIQDDETGVSISDPTVAMYAIGKQISPGYVRFTTSPHAPTWVTGSNSPTNTTACTRGSLYSCTGGSSSSNCKNGGSGQYALWACVPSGSSTHWVPIM